MDRMGLCGFGRRLRYVPTPRSESRYLTSCHMIRRGSFHLHPCVHNQNQVCPGSTTHAVTPLEDLGPGLVNLFLCHADFQPYRVGVCGHGEGEPEEFPSRVSFRVHLSTVSSRGLTLSFPHASPIEPLLCRTLSRFRRWFPLVDSLHFSQFGPCHGIPNHPVT